MKDLEYHIDNLVIEVTRKCNLSCAHCLRGKSENVVLDLCRLPYIFKNVNSIGSITFTGGEPSLYPNIIREILNYLIDNKISYSSFFIATNATFFDSDFILVLLDLYRHAEDKEFCNVSVSIDQYHSSLDTDTYEIYKAFTFYSPMKEHDYFNEQFILPRGNAEENGIGWNSHPIQTEFCTWDYTEIDNNEVNIEASNIYVSANGNIALDCDLSYNMIDTEYNIGKIGPFETDNCLTDIIAQKIKEHKQQNAA